MDKKYHALILALLFIYLLNACVQIRSGDNAITIAAAGDVMLGRNIGKDIDAYGIGYPFARVKQIFKNVDIRFANLEGVISVCKKPYPKKHVLNIRPGNHLALSDAGFTSISLANNHSLDCGPAELLKTKSVLNGLGIGTIGFDNHIKPDFHDIEVRGRLIRFMAYSAVTDPAYEKRFSAKYALFNSNSLNEIRGASRDVDYLVVSMHWGIENSNLPDSVQKSIGRNIIDAGASIVLGHGTHTVQPVERYANGIIFYSMGNLVFDQYGREGAIFILKIKNGKFEYNQVDTKMYRGQVMLN